MRTAVVTGAGRGLGYFVAEQLAAAGWRVVLTTRSEQQAATAIASIRVRVPSADLQRIELDLASLESVRAAADALAAFAPIDALVNNGGDTSQHRVRRETVDGFERTVGTNAWGPWAFTAGVFPLLAPDARVVWLGSLSTRIVRADLDDPEASARRFAPFRQYGVSKHLQHAFAFELDRRLRASGSGIRSVLVHPGYAVDAATSPRPGITDLAGTGQRVLEAAMWPIVQGKERGGLPIVHAVLGDDVAGGDFWGPRFWLKGDPVRTRPVRSSADPEFTRRAWELAAQRTGIPSPAPPAP